MKDIYLDYLNRTRDKKRLSYDEIRSRIDCAKSVSTIQRIFSGQTEPTVEDFELLIERGLGEDLRDVYAQIGAKEFHDSAQVDYKGAAELLADFAEEKAHLREEYEARLAHAKEMRIAEREAFNTALKALEDKYNKGTAYLKTVIESRDGEIEGLKDRALKAEALTKALDEAHDQHCRDIHRRYRYLSWGCIAVVVVALLLGWFIPPPWVI